MNAAVRTEGLIKEFGTLRALDELSLEVQPGAVFGFLGPNGAGKTTTIRILTGLAHATRGKAWVAGMEVTGNGGDTAKRIGYLPEEPTFYGWLTPTEYLDHVARVFGVPATERSARVKELIGLVGLAEASRRRIGGFSHGMRQRMGLAQALVNRPEVLFLDEPVSALDPAGRKEVLELIEQMQGKCTVFMSTHILGDVERVCDSVGIINRGKLVTIGPRQELLERYAVPAIEIAVEPVHKERLAAWVDGLRSFSWVKSTVLDETVLRVVVSDLETAKVQLLASALQARLVLERYEVVRPSLEDVFLQLVSQPVQTAPGQTSPEGRLQ
jgi:ABC-2 type transport system ATP-binding protein